MAKSRKETVYWLSVALYGIALVAVLLYLRFPTAKFREYCRQRIEGLIPGVSCFIGGTAYDFPFALRLANVRLSDATDENILLYEDPSLSIQPQWRHPTSGFILHSRAFGGEHRARVLIESEGDAMELSDVHVGRLDLDALPLLRRRLDRKMTGTVTADGSARIDTADFRIVAARGQIVVTDGGLELKKPILGLTTLDIEESSLAFTLENQRVDITDGKMESPRVNASFAGNIALAEPWFTGNVSLQGAMTPLPPLFQEKRELRAIVTRMQRRHGNTALPFKVGGTIGRPTFLFER